MLITSLLVVAEQIADGMFITPLLDISQGTQNMCIAFIQRRPNVFDVCPAMYKCYKNVLCLLGYQIHSY